MVQIQMKDRYNSDKTWLIKRTECGHYYWNQRICGSVFYNSFTRTTLDHIGQVLGYDNNMVQGWFK